MQGTLTPRLADGLGRLCGATAGIMAVAGTVAAQQTFFTAACDAGIGKAFTFILTGAALYVILKGFLDTLMGVDQSRSRGSAKQQKAGRDRMKGGMKMVFGGIFIPPLMIALINAMGVSLDCLSPGLLV